MTDQLALALAQIDPTVGDLDGNADLIRAARRDAAADGADLVVAGELAVSGYPPEDLVLKRSFQDAVEKTVARLAGDTADGGPAVLAGAPWRHDGGLYNAGLLLDEGTVQSVRLKHELPNYGVFDEKRVFRPGPLPGPVPFRGVRLGVMVCEDMWFPDVAECLDESGAEILLVLNGSPYEVDKPDARLNYAVARVTECGLPLAYVNLAGGQDELVFDGASFVIGADHSLLARLAAFDTDLLTTRWMRGAGGWTMNPVPPSPWPGTAEAIYRALVLGVRDYVNKNWFPGVLVGLSGGIDSALSAAVAVDALGAERVHCVIMPSPYTSQSSLDDAAETARLLGVRLDTISIAPAMQAFDGMLREAFAGHRPDEAEENIQARARAITLMALSNKLGHMLLTTGNKSEMSVGYATLYGDMCGGFSALKDVYKTTVYRLARWRNAHRPDGFRGPRGRVIPEHVITRPPTAELKPDQHDADTLPPYDALDPILECLIEKEMSPDEIAERGHDRATAERVWQLVDQAEYKRRQAPPGVKISSRAFGRDRRYPITNGFTGRANRKRGR